MAYNDIFANLDQVTNVARSNIEAFEALTEEDLKGMQAILQGVGMSHGGRTITAVIATQVAKDYVANNRGRIRLTDIQARIKALKSGILVAVQDMPIHLASEGYDLFCSSKRGAKNRVCVTLRASLPESMRTEEQTKPLMMTSISSEAVPVIASLSHPTLNVRETNGTLDTAARILDTMMTHMKWAGDVFVSTWTSDHLRALRLQTCIQMREITVWADVLNKVFTQTQMGAVELGPRDCIDRIMSALRLAPVESRKKFINSMMESLKQIYPD